MGRARHAVTALLALLVPALLVLAGCSVTTAPATTTEVAAGTPVVVTLGDSVPAGTNCGCTPFPALYAKMLSPSAQSINLAVPGYTTDDVQTQLSSTQAKVSLSAATVVLVMVGANDMANVMGNGTDAYDTTAQKVQSAMTSILGSVEEAHGTPVPVVVLGYWNVVKDGAVGLATYGAAGMKVAQQATTLDNDALQQAADDSGATYLTTSPAFDADPTSLLASDGDHPNAAGHAAIANLLYAAEPQG